MKSGDNDINLSFYVLNIEENIKTQPLEGFRVATRSIPKYTRAYLQVFPQIRVLLMVGRQLNNCRLYERIRPAKEVGN